MCKASGLVLFAALVGFLVAVQILGFCFLSSFWREEFEKFEINCVFFVFFLKFSEVTRFFFNILAEEVLKMRRRGCCGLFLLKLVLFLHSLRFSGEMKFLKKKILSLRIC